MASVVGADFESITPTPIFAALIKFQEIRPLKMRILSRTGIRRFKQNHKVYLRHYVDQYLGGVQRMCCHR